MRHVHLWLRVLGERLRAHVGDDADDDARRLTVQLNGPSERVFARPEHVREPSADDDHGLCTFSIRRDERATGEHRDAQRCEVIDVHDAVQCDGLLSGRRRCLIGSRETPHVFAGT
jgi:hypothetical protein